jgi:hypothetical protein
MLLGGSLSSWSLQSATPTHIAAALLCQRIVVKLKSKYVVGAYCL